MTLWDTHSRRRWGRNAALLAPAALLTGVVVCGAIATLALTALGLMPLVGQPRLSGAGFAAEPSDLLLGLRESLVIAVASTVLAVGIGLSAAVLLLRSTRVVRALAGLMTAVVLIPHLVGASAVGLLLADAGVLPRLLGVGSGWPELVGGPWHVATVLEFAWKESAFIALVVTATVGPGVGVLNESAALLGAGPRQRLRRVTLPLMAPAATAGAVIVFLYTLGSYEVAWLLGRAYPEPLPVLARRLFTSIDVTARPEAAAVALVAVTVALLAAGLGVRVLNRLGAAR